jgi:DNA processing protein
MRVAQMHLLDMRSARRQVVRRRDQRRYTPPETVGRIQLSELLRQSGRPELESKQLDMLRRGETTTGKDIIIRYAGDLHVLARPAVAIVGTREASSSGLQRADWLSCKLAQAGVTIVSGLAKGIDRRAHDGAIAVGGKTAAVIGTPLDKAYPVENAELQELIYREHLLITPFAAGEAVYKSNFPARNRVMAAVSDATVIVEASDTSGTLHQAAECTRLKRWLFISRAIVDDPAITWPARFLSYEKTVVLNRVSEILDRVQR